MASREDILPGDDDVKNSKENNEEAGVGWTTNIFGLLSFTFLVLAVGVGFATGQRDPVTWLQSYSKFWVYFTLPYLAIRDGSVYR